MKKKYSKGFNDNFLWFLSMRHIFIFDGSYDADIVFDRNGIDGKRCFFLIESQGKYLPTKHNTMVKTLIHVKGSVDLHIKMYAEDRAKHLLTLAELDFIGKDYNFPYWVYDAIENQKINFL